MSPKEGLEGQKGNLFLYCKWDKRLYDKDGNLKVHKSNYNVITSAGVSALVLLLKQAVTSASVNNFKYIATGSDATGESTADTALGTEIGRHTCTVSYSAGAILEVTGTFAAGSSTGAITEYGILDANSGGSLLNRDVESVINVGASDTLQVTAQITFNPG